ncbi:periplasmic chaperone for outer membrane proteins SurA [Alkalispirillum mobile]|uniref:Chaperone SurA n=1 Tax=Alkalispirillum mobile TaxID=85925 RepID=A0A498CGU2_9GAMM|nr:peptidylprolyl isomerase [Alkalispirillum mobile]RLK51551.1 periplasmic chaperone for outer membrane proteins SurA [Alkalispirillum mobile]
MTAITRTILTGTLLTVALLLAALQPARAESLDRIIAVVDDQVVLASELDREMATIANQLRGRGQQLPPQDTFQRQVLERLITQRVQLSRAQRVGINIDDATLDAAMQRMAQQNNMTMGQFRQAVEQEGFEFNYFREGIREEIAISRLRQAQVEEQVTVTPQEVEEVLETLDDENQEYRLGHILIATPEAASSDQLEEARERAEQLREQIVAGETDFEGAATAFSDAATAMEGGDLGWRLQGQLPSLFAEAIDAGLQTGEVSEVLQNSSGFHLVKLMDQRTQGGEHVAETRARHILIRTDGDVITDEDASLRLQSLRERVEDGESFTELAEEYSEDTGSAARGGDLGWTRPGQLVPEFQGAMDALDEGEISMPFATPFGWHIVQVTDRRERDITRERLRDQLAQQIHQRKAEEAFEQWIRRLRDEAYVDVRVDQ